MNRTDADHPSESWMSVAAAAGKLGVPTTAIRRWIKDGALDRTYSLTQNRDGREPVNLIGLETAIAENKAEVYVTIAEATQIISVSRSTLLGWIEGNLLRAWKFRGQHRVTVLDLRNAYVQQRALQVNTANLAAWLAFIAAVVSILLDHSGLRLREVLIILGADSVWLVFTNRWQLRSVIRSWDRRKGRSALGLVALTIALLWWFLWPSTRGRGKRREATPEGPPHGAPDAMRLLPLSVTSIAVPILCVLLIITMIAPLGFGPLSARPGDQGPLPPVAAIGLASPAAQSTVLATSRPLRVRTSTVAPTQVPALARATTPSPTATPVGCQPPARLLSHAPTFDYPYDGQILDLEGSYHFRAIPVEGADGYSWQFKQGGVMMVDGGIVPFNVYVIGEGTTDHTRFGPGQVEVSVRARICGAWTVPRTITITLVPRPPTPTPSVDSREACQVPPRPLESIQELDFERSVPEPTAFALPEGVPADDAIVAAITGTMNELVACLNAGEFLRAYALYTDEGLRSTFFADGPPTRDQLDALAGEPVPVATEEQSLMPVVQDTRMLADGRVAALVIGDVPMSSGEGEETHVFIFVQAGDRWLIDEQGNMPSGSEPTP